MTIVLPFPNNFKKSARYLDDHTLCQQIADIETFHRNIFYENQNEIDQKDPSILYYIPQLKWILKYQLALCEEYAYRFGNYPDNVELYYRQYKRLQSKKSGLHDLFGKTKWAPVIVDPIFGPSTDRHFISKYYQYELQNRWANTDVSFTRRKPPRAYFYNPVVHKLHPQDMYQAGWCDDCSGDLKTCIKNNECAGTKKK